MLLSTVPSTVPPQEKQGDLPRIVQAYRRCLETFVSVVIGTTELREGSALSENWETSAFDSSGCSLERREKRDCTPF
jgi:hypothetical protein